MVFRQTEKGGQREDKGINRPKDRSHLFFCFFCETYCRSEIISIFTFVLLNLSQHNAEQKDAHLDPLWIPVTCYRSSWLPVFSIWLQLDIKLKSALRQTKPREEMGHTVTLISCAEDNFLFWNWKCSLAVRLCTSLCTYGSTTLSNINWLYTNTQLKPPEMRRHFTEFKCAIILCCATAPHSHNVCYKRQELSMYTSLGLIDFFC